VALAGHRFKRSSELGTSFAEPLLKTQRKRVRSKQPGTCRNRSFFNMDGRRLRTALGRFVGLDPATPSLNQRQAVALLEVILTDTG
jgi:hypothetical protein